MELRKPVEMPELKTGMFGIENDGECFVVVGDLIVYEGGRYEDVDTFNNYGDIEGWMAHFDKDGNLITAEDGGYEITPHIDKLFGVGTVTCFNQVKSGEYKPIWKHGDTE